MTDTHTHIYMDEFTDGGGDALLRALSAGVSHMVFPNVDASSIAAMKSLHHRFPDNTSIAIGLHPTEINENWEKIVDDMEKELATGDYVAIGEVGMDLYWDKTYRKEQMEAFARQLRMAEKYGLPVIIHCREALDETLEVIGKVKPDVALIFHSFSGSPDDVKKIRAVCNPMFGINGVVTFKNAQPLRDALPEIGLDRILLETDSPYLAPVPHRGKRNESSYLPAICAKIAETLDIPVENVERQTDINAKTTFRI